jgi:hypothetical protein
MTSRFKRRIEPALAAIAAAIVLAGCGGGGDGGSTAAPAAGAGDRAVSLSGGSALMAAPPGLSGNVTCDNLAIGAVSLDTVTVPANAACRLEGTVLIGSILVNQGAMLEASAVRLNGSVQAEGAAHVTLADASSVGGSVQVKQGGSAAIAGAQITGDLQIDSMRGTVFATGNRLGGSLQAVANRGGVTITGNTMNGNLQCKENAPAPLASDNVAASIEDQCVPGASGGSGGVGGGTVPAPGGLSGNVTCDGLRIGAVSLDTVVVPAGASCVLEGTRLVGSIIVGANATLGATGVRVNGNVQAEGAASVLLGGASAVGGSVQLKQGGSATVGGVSIGGDLQIDAMNGPVAASGNAIGGNLQAVGNRGGLSLAANRMIGALQCKENQPAPSGSGNVASIKEDQCRAL